MTTKRAIGEEGAQGDASHMGTSASTPAHNHGVTVGDGTVADETVPPVARGPRTPCSASWLERMFYLTHAEIVAPEPAGTQGHTVVVGMAPAKVSPTACLCVACGRVSETSRDCPWCQSRAMLNISRILDR